MSGALVVDARALHASGIGRYLRAMLSRWLADPPFASLVLLGDPGPLGDFVREHPSTARVEIAPHAGGFYSAAAQVSWLRWLARSHQWRRAVPDAVHFFPHWDAPVAAFPRRGVVTVHDLIHLRVPDAADATRRAVAARVLRRVTRSAARIVTVSHATARDVAAWDARLADRVRVVANGVDPAPVPAPAPVVDGPYLLCVGNQKRHKNLVVAVEVLARLRAEHPALRLVIAGRRYAGWELVSERARALGVPEPAVVELGEVAEDTLWGLYAGAAALLFPSRYEGFGLPALEAMAAGTPVVVAATPALRETVGDAALVVPVDDADQWTEATASVLGSSALRADLVARGRRRAAALSWDASARETAAVLRELAGAEATNDAAAVRVG